MMAEKTESTQPHDDYVYVSGSDGKTHRVKRSEKDAFIESYNKRAPIKI